MSGTRTARTRASDAVGGERARQRRPDELRPFLRQPVEQHRQRLGIRVVLEPGERDRPQPIVAVGLDFPHHIAGGRPAEAGEQGQRAEARVLIRVRARSLGERRHGDLGRRTPDEAGRVRPRRVIERTELVDRGRDVGSSRLRGGGRGRLGPFATRSLALTGAQRAAGKNSGSRGRENERSQHHSTSFSANCRYACSFDGTATG